MPEYRSETEIGGIPLVHVVSGEGGKTAVARGWIAIGDVAFGVVFAAGGLAVGGITLGGASLGFLAVGGLAVGGLSLGGLSIGIVALGGMALAVQLAVGGGAVSLGAAVGGTAQSLGLVDVVVPQQISTASGQLDAKLVGELLRQAFSTPLLLLGLAFPLASLYSIAAHRQEKQLSGPAP